MDQKTQEKIDAIIEILKQTTTGRCAIALAGAHAKGMADPSSDIDLYLFADGAKPYAERKAIITAAADEGSSPWIDEAFDATPWGGSMDFMYQGTPVEVTARTIPAMDAGIADSLNGTFSIIPATWTSNGYYTYIYLCEASFIKPVYDPDGIIARYNEQARVYPPKLKQAIIQEFMGRADTWLYNFHYESAIRRADLLFIAPILVHTVMDFVQVIFALNETYFTGDKKLEKMLAALPYCPQTLLENVEFLLSVPRDVDALLRQRELLRAVRTELAAKIG